MLHPKNNRIDYGEQLMPPAAGYELTEAIGTTYSLDLEALMVLPVALFYSHNLDLKPDEVRYEMLDAITKSAEKIKVFCQNGRIKIPRNYHHLMAYWESGIVEINMPNHISSFHPKVWIIRFEKKGKPVIYKALITSRNLTYARDFDIAVSFDGEVGNQPIPQNQPLVDFVRYLSRKSKDSNSISNRFISDLMKVNFQSPDKFTSADFFPIGISKEHENPLLQTRWDDLLIITPFADDNSLNAIKTTVKNKPDLISRKEELDKLSQSTIDKFNCYQFSNLLRDAEMMVVKDLESGGEIALNENCDDIKSMDLHAKIYIGSVSKDIFWLLGSANCSAPAFDRNIEFLTKIKAEGKQQKSKDILNLLKSNNDGFQLIEEYVRVVEQPIDTSDLSNEAYLRKLRFDLSKLEFRGKANPRGEILNFDIIIEVILDNIHVKDNYKVRIAPLNEKNSYLDLLGNQPFEFKNAYIETDLTPFLKIEIYHQNECVDSFVLRMIIELPETRLKRIFSSIINNQEKFLKYLQFLLEGDSSEIIQEIDSNMNKQLLKKEPASDTWSIFNIPVYEKLLVAASRNPEKIETISRLIDRIKSETDEHQKPIITKEFELFWEKFKNYYATKDERRL